MTPHKRPDSPHHFGSGAGSATSSTKQSLDIEHANETETSRLSVVSTQQLQNEQQHQVDSAAARALNRKALHYMIIFFSAMIVHELAMEACTSDPLVKGLDALPLVVTVFQFSFCVLLPVIVSRGKALQAFPRIHETPKEIVPYIGLSIIVFGASGVANVALKYVTYPTKVIFKSAKLIPTMMVDSVIHRKTYSFMEYTAALFLCLGAAGYAYSWEDVEDNSSANNSNAAQQSDHLLQQQQNSMHGIILLLISVFCDAIVPNIQQSLMAAPSSSSSQSPDAKTSPPTTPTNSHHHICEENDQAHYLKNHHHHNHHHGAGRLSAGELMVNTNAVGVVGLLCYIALMGYLPSTIFILTNSHPRILIYLTCVGMGLGTAVLAYTQLIQASGSVVAVSVATLRKVATMILSYVVFPKRLLVQHIGSGLLVLAGITLSSWGKQQKSHPKQ